VIPGHEALARLREGNERFVARLHDTNAPPRAGPPLRLVPTESQEPFAIILGCSDSRVPAELVFDQGFGDLFVIRVAGNIVAPSQVGSVEFAAARFGTRLAVVLGHTHCGAIEGTLDELRQPTPAPSPNLKYIIDCIRPAVAPLLAGPHAQDRDALFGAAVRANIRLAADHLRHGSEVLERLIRRDGLMIAGAEYCLETGVVDFFDGMPDPA